MRVRPLVKICGVMRVEDARGAVSAGAALVGAILSPGFGRSVTPDHAATYLRDPAAGSADLPTLVAVMVDPEADQAVEAARRSGAGVIQLHGQESPQMVREVARAGPWRVWKAVRGDGPEQMARAVERYGQLVDGLLLEGGRPGERGGGRGFAFSREAAAELRGLVPESVELVLAGGLTPANVAEAVQRFRPDVVDVSSGVEAAHGQKDPARVAAFVRNARNEDHERGS